MKELEQVCLVVKLNGYGERGSVVTPNMLASKGISVRVDGEHLVLSGSTANVPLRVRGLLDGRLAETSHVETICDNVLTTKSGSHYLIKSVCMDYVELCDYEKDGGTILFDWCLGLDHNGNVHMSAQSYSNGKFSYIDKKLNCKTHNKVSLEGDEFFVIWDSINFCQEFRLVAMPMNKRGGFTQSFFCYMNPEDPISIAKCMSAADPDPNYADPKTATHLLNKVFG